MIAKFSQNKIIPLFYYVFSSAILVRFINDIFNLNRWAIHSRNIFPYRHIPGFPLYSTPILIGEWALALVGAVLLIKGKIRIAALLIVISYTFGLTQLFQNQKVLTLIVALTLLVEPLAKKSSIYFLKWQLILVYLFSGIHKINGQFASGETMRVLFLDVLKMDFGNSWLLKAFSWFIIISELAMPIILIKRPKIGIIFVILLHGGMCLLMPDIGAFSLVMIALALLFYPVSK